jgi:hypothetical protein
MSATAPPSRPPTSSILYDWPRYWIPQTGILDLSDAGFLRDPVDSLYGPGPLRTLPQLEGSLALALLGEPGIGKCRTSSWCSRLASTSLRGSRRSSRCGSLQAKPGMAST